MRGVSGKNLSRLVPAFIAPDRGFRQRIGYAKDIKLQARAETLDRLDVQCPSCMTIV